MLHFLCTRKDFVCVCITCDDVDVGVVALRQLYSVTVPLKRLPQLLLDRSRATQPIQSHDLNTHTHTHRTLAIINIIYLEKYLNFILQECFRDKTL